LFLEGGGCAEGGIEGDVVLLFAGGARLDITPVFAVGPGEGTSAGVFAGKFVERGVEPARLEGLAGFYLLPTIPPVCARIGEGVLAVRLGLSLLGTFLSLILEF
jgi:hypothetical protein